MMTKLSDRHAATACKDVLDTLNQVTKMCQMH